MNEIPSKNIQTITFKLKDTIVTITSLPNGYKFVFNEKGEINSGVVQYEGNGIYKISVNNGDWQYINVNEIIKPSKLKPNMIAPCAISPSCGGGGGDPILYWWYDTLFIKGYPVRYPHPYRDYYQILPTDNWERIAGGIWNYQIGSSIVNIYNLSVGIIASIIAGIIASPLSGPIAVLVSQAVFALVYGVINVVENLIAIDEAGAIWFWFNSEFYYARFNIPWYILLGGAQLIACWLWSQVSYFRVGGVTFINYAGFQDP